MVVQEVSSVLEMALRAIRRIFSQVRSSLISALL